MTTGFAERILHVDMDAFFVEVERLRNPALVGGTVVVGGLGPRGVVAAASYEARRSGVASAMPMVEARRRCPHATFLPPDHREYSAVSSRVFDVLRGFTPLIEAISVDEAFLDIGGLRLHYPDPSTVAEAIRSTIRTEVGIPASAGVATSKFIAKLASESAKPDGMMLVTAGAERAFLDPLPVDRMWGVGAATLAVLEALGIRTVGDLAVVPLEVLQRRAGRSLGRHLHDLAHGIDDRAIEPDGEMKSVSVEETFDTDVYEREDVERRLLALCERLAGRLRKAGTGGRTVHLKVRFEDFTTITRSSTGTRAVRHGPELWEAVRALLERTTLEGRGVRLLGVGVSLLEATGAPQQLSLDRPRRGEAARAVDRVKDRFGDDAVVPARLLEPPGRAGS